MPLVVGQGLDSAIVTGETSGKLVRFAAAELQEYLQQITGIQIPIRAGHSDAPNVFLLETRGSEIPQDNPEAFAIKSVTRDGKNVILFSGAQELAVKHAVYYFLERYCGVGFFPDGDRVLRRAELVFDEIDCARRPAFRYRVYFPHIWQGETRGKASGLWLYEDWKRMMDWMGKKGFNVVCPYGLLALREILARAFPEHAAEVAREPRFSVLPENERLEIARKVVAYAREMGFQLMFYFSFSVPSSFVKEHAVRTHKHALGNLLICQGDPKCKEIIRRNVDATIEVLGKADIYMSTQWCEQDICEHADSRWETERDFYEVVKERDADGQFVIWTWDWPNPMREQDLGGFRRFPTEALLAEWEAHKKSLPEEVIIADWDRNYFLPTKGFEGRRWWLMHHTSFEGFDLPFTWHTPSELLANRAQELGAEGFVVFNIAPNSNGILAQYAAELAWRPEASFAAFLRTYSAGRYGAASVEGMVRCYGLLEEAARNRIAFTFLGGDLPFLDNLRLHLMLDPLEACASRCAEARHCALEQEEGEKANPLYQNDLLELQLVSLRLAGVVNYLRGRFFFARGDFPNAIEEFCRSVQSFQEMAALMQEDERYNIALTRQWLESMPGANLELYDQSSAIHRSFITCFENAVSAAGAAREHLEKSRRGEKAGVSIWNSVMHWSTRDIL